MQPAAAEVVERDGRRVLVLDTRALPEADGYALDISREAVKRACKRAPQLTWLVASMARVPLGDASCDLLASVFSPLDWAEAKRLAFEDRARYFADPRFGEIPIEWLNSKAYAAERASEAR